MNRIPDMRAVLTFQGFTESIRTRTGTEDLYFNVIRKLSGEHVTTFQPVQWTVNAKQLAGQVARQNIRRVALVSYSHGQAAALDFAAEAYKLGVETDLWLACDPVYRPAWLPRLNLTQPLAFRALIPQSAKIAVRTPIKRIAGVRQKLNIPRGHDIVAKHPGIHVEPFKVLEYTHVTIDQAPEWFTLVDTKLKRWRDE